LIILKVSSVKPENYQKFGMVLQRNRLCHDNAMNKTIEVHSGVSALVNRALELILPTVETAVSERGQFTIALSGGSTPKPLYEAIANQNLPWDKIHVFWGDERYVPADHPDSNELMARRAWLDRVAIPAANIHAIPTLAANPEVDAAKYNQHLQTFFKSTSGEFPPLDVVLLGMGDDAHTASLFPHTEALKVCDRLITVGNKDDNHRITFTYPFINAARNVIFLVAGANKRPALAQIFAPVADDFTYPSRLIKPQGKLYWLLDAAAGLELKP
jgi:6-phosphogluconolactonase